MAGQPLHGCPQRTPAPKGRCNLAAILVDLPLGEAARRAVSRYYLENRFVDPEYIYGVGDAPDQNYGRIKAEARFDDYERYSNDVPYGEPPRLIESTRTQAEDTGRDVPTVSGQGGRGRTVRAASSDGSKAPGGTTEQPSEEVGPGPEGPGPSLSEDSSPRFATRESSGNLNLWPDQKRSEEPESHYYVLTRRPFEALNAPRGVEKLAVNPDPTQPYGWIYAKTPLTPEQMAEMGAFESRPAPRQARITGQRFLDFDRGLTHQYAGNGKWQTFLSGKWDAPHEIPDTETVRFLNDTPKNRQAMTAQGRSVQDPDAPPQVTQGTLFAVREQMPGPEYFKKPDKRRELPPFPDHVLRALNVSAKPVILERWWVVKNRIHHPELQGWNNADILENAIWHPSLLVQDQPKEFPGAWVFIKQNGRTRLAVVEVLNTPDGFVPKSWRYSSKQDVDRIVRRANREGGQVLIPDNDAQGEAQGAVDLPAFPVEPSKGDYTTPAEEDKPQFATRDMDLGLGPEDHDAFDKYVHSINTTKLDMSNVDSPEAALRAILTGS